MLVLSRKSQQSIDFPTLGVSVQILKVAGQTVRVGVEAPREVPVLRSETAVFEETLERVAKAQCEREADRALRHAVRGRLHNAAMSLHLAEEQLKRGLTEKAENVIQNALEQLSLIEVDLAPPQPAEKEARQKIRTLLVEDNPHESALLESYLRLNGLDVVNAYDGLEALDYLKSHELPDAMLLDMRMPRCDGPTTVAAIRANPSYQRMKIFAVSGTTQKEANLPSGPKGVDGWFAKPFNPAKLVEALSQAVN